MDETERTDAKNLEVLIDGRVYTLVGACSEEHLQRIGRYIDRKIAEARRVKTIKSYNFDLNTLFIIINIVDELLHKTDRVNTFVSENTRLANDNKKMKSDYDELNKRLSTALNELEKEKREHLKTKEAAGTAEAEKKEVKK